VPLVLGLALSHFVHADMNPYIVGQTVASGGALLDEGFNGIGYENSWTEYFQEGEGAGRTIDEDYATSPAPLEGTHSLRMTSDSYKLVSNTVSLSSASSDVSVSFILRPLSVAGTDNQDFLTLLDSSDNVLCILSISSASDNLNIQQTGGTKQYGSSAITTAATIYLWIDHTASTGSADGKTSLYRSANSTKPGTATSSCTNGTATADVAKLKISIKESYDFTFDSIIITNL